MTSERSVSPGSEPRPGPVGPGTSRYRVGCSGWQYRHWRGNFYPADLPQSRWLDYYAARFDTVELNNSFYRLPAEGAFGAWRARTPPRFLFAVKASRYLTHMKKLKDPRDPIDLLFSRASELGRKLGPVLYQLPRQLQKDLGRLRLFLEALPQPRRFRHAIEFRHTSWYCDEVFRLMDRHRVALCVHDMPDSIAPRLVIGGFIYLRFHGATGRYTGRYPISRLRSWSDWVAVSNVPAYAYFNNDIGGHAPKDALCLKGLLAGKHLD